MNNTPLPATPVDFLPPLDGVHEKDGVQKRRDGDGGNGNPNMVIDMGMLLSKQNRRASLKASKKRSMRSLRDHRQESIRSIHSIHSIQEEMKESSMQSLMNESMQLVSNMQESMNNFHDSVQSLESCHLDDEEDNYSSDDSSAQETAKLVRRTQRRLYQMLLEKKLKQLQTHVTEMERRDRDWQLKIRTLLAQNEEMERELEEAEEKYAAETARLNELTKSLVQGRGRMEMSFNREKQDMLKQHALRERHFKAELNKRDNRIAKLEAQLKKHQTQPVEAALSNFAQTSKRTTNMSFRKLVTTSIFASRLGGGSGGETSKKTSQQEQEVEELEPVATSKLSFKSKSSRFSTRELNSAIEETTVSTADAADGSDDDDDDDDDELAESPTPSEDARSKPRVMMDKDGLYWA